VLVGVTAERCFPRLLYDITSSSYDANDLGHTSGGRRQVNKFVPGRPLLPPRPPPSAPRAALGRRRRTDERPRDAPSPAFDMCERRSVPEPRDAWRGVATLYCRRRPTVTSFCSVSTPVDFCRHLVGTTSRNVCHCGGA